MQSQQAPEDFANDMEAYFALTQDLQQMERLLEEAKNQVKARKLGLYRKHHQHCGTPYQVGDRIVLLPVPDQGHLPDPIIRKPL